VAGTLPHAVFVETGIGDAEQAMAFAGELTGCAAVGSDPAAAVASLPARVTAFVRWLSAGGESLTEPVGNWYEVERVSAVRQDGGAQRRAAFSLDDLAPSPDEFETWLRWSELAREDLAVALDTDPAAAERLAWLAAQDESLAAELGAPGPASAAGGAVDRLYAAREALMAALMAAGPAGTGARRALRLAIADDLRAAEQIRGR
jgi:hypothetical protein